MADTPIIGGQKAVDEDKLNTHYKSLLDEQIDSADSDGTPRLEQPKGNPRDSKTTDGGVMKSPLMTFTKMLEAMDEVETSMESPAEEPDTKDILDEPTETEAPVQSDDDLLDTLNKIFTPVLITQGVEQEIADKANTEMTEAAVLTEKNMIAFDDETRMAQLIATCALLIARKKDTANWKLFAKAAAIKTKAKIAIQNEEYDAAKTLAQKYLLQVSNTSNSAVARQAATELLPQTQH